MNKRGCRRSEEGTTLARAREHARTRSLKFGSRAMASAMLVAVARARMVTSPGWARIVSRMKTAAGWGCAERLGEASVRPQSPNPSFPCTKSATSRVTCAGARWGCDKRVGGKQTRGGGGEGGVGRGLHEGSHRARTGARIQYNQQVCMIMIKHVALRRTPPFARGPWAPCATGTSLRLAHSVSSRAFRVAVSVVTLPNVVVIPTTSISGELKAARMVMASSIPGS